MAKTLSELVSQINADIKRNGNREITPEKHNAIEQALAMSALNIKDGGNIIESLAGYTSLLTLTDNKNFAHKKYVDDAITSAYYADLTANTDVDVNGHAFRFLNGTDELFKVAANGNVTVGDTLFINSISGGMPTIDFNSAAPGSYTLRRDGTALQFNSVGIYKVLQNSGVRFDTPAEDDPALVYNGASLWTFFKETKYLDNLAIGNVPDYMGGMRVMFITNADAEPTSAAVSGSLLWGFANQLRTWNDLQFMDGATGPVLEDRDNPGSFVRLFYSTSGGIQVEAA